MTENRSLSTAEAARELHVAPATIRRMIAAGRLPAVRAGPPPRGQLRIPVSAMRLLPSVFAESEVR